MTELATKEDLQAVVDSLNEQLSHQHSLNKTLVMIINELLLNTASASAALVIIAKAQTQGEISEDDLARLKEILDGFLSGKPERHRDLCVLLSKALMLDGGKDGMEERLREAFSKRI